ncbi:P-loop containing nucleoside triphosphate hydrolase protein [Suillus bovinus]|uniref:P-loop containing nucleoside triphosphate hydrolase protein n=1 Tax=Suillus bovinus TaxID=48563 RepID=UPI001B876D95|nr:P-loop containing nucleoside triphosphate hydrolase protein [Suillus bovinus]KAG2145383.1 P-loop containing nucleoside triphosphate hydrolase protein [Suillus bovinus]
MPAVISTATRLLSQNLMEVDSGKLSVHTISESNLIEEQHQLRSLFERNEGRTLGLSGGFALTGELAMLAIADTSTIIIIAFELKKGKGNGHDKRPVTSGNTAARVLLQNLLRRTTGLLYAFDIASIALALFQTLDLRIANAIDMQSAGTKTHTSTPLFTIKQAIGDLHGVLDPNINEIFRDDIVNNDLPPTKNGSTSLALRAWITHYLSQISTMVNRLARVPPVDTFRLSDQVLRFLAKSSKDSFQLEQKKPTEVTRRFTTSVDHMNNRIYAQADRYQNRIRKSHNQRAFIAIGGCPARGFTVDGHVSRSDGRVAKLATSTNLNFIGKNIGLIKIVGRGDPTQAEFQRAQKVLEVLQGLVNLEHDNPWVQLIFFSSPDHDLKWPSAWTEEANDADIVTYRADCVNHPLNPSQIEAVTQMLQRTNDRRLTVIQGPPGTGKTTVIASFVQIALASGLSGIWLIAQSNVAVKNIAEKLARSGLINWKLLVSKDFFEEWHEHLYVDIRANVIISNDFKAPSFCQELKSTPVILCTLSMLSSSDLRRFGGFNAAPIRTLVVDEASQIEIGDYIPVFTSHASIRKVCFIGDDKQLPPHGQDDIQDLKSIFEVKHLRDRAIFLNVQCKSDP